MRAVEIGEAHLEVEWQVLDICLELCPFYTTVEYRDSVGICLRERIFFEANMLWGQRM